MDETIDSPTNAHEYSVSEISIALKRTVEDAFGNVRVRGEISGYRGPHSSGHAYFSLKDDRSRIEAVIWKGTFGKLKFRPEEGMEVIATGKLTTYPGSSKYQIVIDNLEPAGAGALMALLEERKRRLQAEGLFDAGRKQLLPYLPRVIGVVTSPTGAVIRDIIHRISDRFPLHVVVWPVRVQGETTGAEVANAVAGFNALPEDGDIARPDVIIVARGGGSLEDLWGFNDEAVVRAVAASDIPVISAVGHETDWTLIDLAADVRAPTPTGAAEMAVPVKVELEATLTSLGARLRTCTSRHLDRQRQAVRSAARALPSPDQLFALPRRRFDDIAGRLDRAAVAAAERRRARLSAIRLSPATLERGIAEARRHLARNAAQLPRCADAYFERRRLRLQTAAARLTIEPFARRNAEARRGLERAALRLPRVVDALLAERRKRLAQATRLVDSLSVKSVLDRGFALVEHEDGTLAKRAAEISDGMRLALRFADGTRSAVAGDGSAGGEAPRQRPKSGTAKPPSGQGDLF
ncbi:exodeoxyribonuclease VII large subunit [Mesorhizobium sp. J428]|uniref:exodeoxyribonuclease VII large subunit n=1 Tax=Mesorhizobium sp. J428 TaxID=2898440 RepID=UPI00215147C8|nr:exodeoxyribonuclease VII large subunit [Mesorhizobium sp. J428]MCR5858477.1 exodeoxyribonuclease VII large subunit [Mesorhizobium sp. J428]